MHMFYRVMKGIHQFAANFNQWFIEYCSMKCWIKQAR